MRLFVAIDLPEQVRAELDVLQDSLSIGRPVPTENFHLTLCFLGEQHDEAAEDAHQALSSIRAAAFDLQLAGVGSFGKRLPQTLHAEVARCHALDDLETRVTRALRHAGLEFDKRRFRPHVTIARLPKLLPAPELAQAREFLAANAGFQGSRFEVSRFQLYRSTLTTRGALHEGLASYDLGS